MQNLAALGSAIARSSPSALRKALKQRAGVLKDYGAAISGSGGRLIFSLIYFVALANTLSIAEFGLFATASATGVVLSRIVGFGFITTLYRMATVRPHMLGVFGGGFILMTIASIPPLLAAAAIVYAAFFSGEMALSAFALIIVAECLLWRPTEAIVIVNNGLGRFGRASLLVILGIALRAAAALLLMFGPWRDLGAWALFYLASNAAALVVGITLLMPAARFRFKPKLYWRRLPDSIYVAGSEILFYLQMELDKLLVLSLGGAHLAGIYAIIMRLVDLTGIPIRVFTMMLVQKIMKTPDLMAGMLRRIGIETAILIVSTAALGVLALLLYRFPNLLGSNVAEVAPLLILVLMVPGLRNLVEYQAELLFARGQTLIRTMNLALLGVAKAVLLMIAINHSPGTQAFIFNLNYVFAALYAASAMLTYSAMRMPAKTL